MESADVESKDLLDSLSILYLYWKKSLERIAGDSAKHGEGRSGKSTSGAGSVTWKSVPLNLFFTRYGDYSYPI